jgi:hypothetical protein
MNIVIVLTIFGLLGIVFMFISVAVSYAKCSKTSWSTSAKEGFIASSVPALLYALAKYSPYVMSIYAEPLSSEMLGVAYIMMLGGFVMITRMIHETEIAVCKPSVDELKKFQDDLMKELKEKEAEKHTQ